MRKKLPHFIMREGGGPANGFFILFYVFFFLFRLLLDLRLEG